MIYHFYNLGKDYNVRYSSFFANVITIFTDLSHEKKAGRRNGMVAALSVQEI